MLFGDSKCYHSGDAGRRNGAGSVAWTQADIDALDQAIADSKGARQISFNNQTLQLNSIAEMLQLRAVMQREVDAASSPAYRLAVVRKGTE